MSFHHLLIDLRFTVPGTPQAKQRPRHGNGRTYTPEETRQYETFVGWCARQAGASPTSEPVFLRVRVFKPVPKKKRGLNLAYCPVRPDIDNYLKIVMDGLNGVAWIDDGQVCRVDIEKRFSTEPRVEVSVSTHLT